MSKLLLVSPLFVYFPQILAGAETQPWLSVLCATFLLLHARGHREQLAFVAFVVLLALLGALRWVIEGSMVAALSFSFLAVGPLVMFGTLAARLKPPSRRTIKFITLALAALATFELALPGAYETIVDLILPRYFIADGHHGLSLFTPEPSYAVTTLTYFLLLALWSRQALGSRYPWAEWVLATLLVGTLSTYAIVLIAIIGFFLAPKKTSLAAAAAVCVMVLLGLSFQSHQLPVRGVVALTNLLSLQGTDILYSLARIDPSLGIRAILTTAGGEAALTSAAGYGLTCGAVPRALSEMGYSVAFAINVLNEVMEDGCLKAPSYLSSFGFGTGMLAFPALYLLAVLVRYTVPGRGLLSARRLPLLVAMVMLALQSQMTNPIPWMLIAISLSTSGSGARFKLHRQISEVEPSEAQQSVELKRAHSSKATIE